ncbi:MAG: hypothetical protein KDI32_08425 [Pseudomonadales bacterium]|nr:hypothetical protein [Pseudomonadales bacterium]
MTEPVDAEIIAPLGSPLGAAVLACADLDRAVDFYGERIGFDVGPVRHWDDPALAVLAAGPPGLAARSCLLTSSVDPVGQILLLQFVGASGAVLPGQPIHTTSNSRGVGLANLNFYSANLRATTTEFRAAGFEFWTDPTIHDMSGAVGKPIEVLFDGPDGVAINLVELASTDPTTRIGQMRAFVERHGRNRRGLTPVVTTSHVVRSIAASRAFYERVLGMKPLIDVELNAPESNAFLRLPTDARTHIVFMQGNHMFGKLALSEPLNYLEQCVDLAARAHAPNRGYLAQIFEVDDVGVAYWACREVNAVGVTAPTELQIPGFGRRRGLVVRAPGSGALQWLISRNLAHTETRL